ncbi:MAG: transcriptional repressor [Chloroflexi bacterium]|nr:transcriptional repressor [Chloroflexota bacterium]
MSCENATAQVLKDSGHRLTPQRLMILSAVRHTSGHMTAAQIIAEVREGYPYIDASTVYRTLAVLKKMRLVSETNMGSSEAVYEWIEQAKHHHLICKSCGGVALLEDRYVASVGADIMEDHGFRADLDHFAIFGLCAPCAED